MGAITGLTNVAAWERVWDGLADPDAAPVLVLKTSPHCGLSRSVEARFLNFAGTLPDDSTLALLSVDVVNARVVARRIAADTGVTHESPQALLLVAGRKVAWNASHLSIGEESLANALSAL